MKRVVSVFFCFMFAFALLILRLYRLAQYPVVESGTIEGTESIETGSSRGFIYDCAGLPFVNESRKAYVVVSPTAGVRQTLKPVIQPFLLSQAMERLESGHPVLLPVSENVYGAGMRMVYNPVRYGKTFLIPHIAGYCDSTGHGVCGLEKGYDDILSERKALVSFPVDATGHVLCGEEMRVRDEGVLSPRGVVLTIEKSLQATVRDAMLKSGIRKGAVVLLDARTGDIKAMVSVPEYDVQNPGKSLEDPDGPFLNRALHAVSVGSVYKMIVAAAALQNGVPESFSYTCKGFTVQNGITFHCHNHAGHGELQMADAMYHSCNPWFIELAKQIPVSDILNLSWKLGLGTANELAKGVTGASGILPEEEELLSDAARANIAFGQGRLTATPVQIAAATAVFANEGVYHAPRLLLGIRDESGKTTANPPSPGQQVLSKDIADRVKALLVYTAGKTERLSDVDCGGKTATAQSGIYRNGEEVLNTWYSGFFPSENPQYVLTILCEDGSSGAEDCTPVFRAICRNILN